MTGILADVRVVSLSTGIAGPNAARMLANYGAEVYKVESRAGGLDAFRSYGDSPEASPRFVEVNLNTRSVTLNLKRPEGVELLKELVARSDVVMDNFRPGVMERLGLAPSELSLSLRTSSSSACPGWAPPAPSPAMAPGGRRSPPSPVSPSGNHPGQERPIGSQGVYPDYLTGVMVPLVVTAALLQRRRTGAGAVIDVAQVDLAAYMLGTILLDTVVNHRDALPRGNDSAHMAPHGCYRCAGIDRYCVVAVQSDEQWLGLCRVVGPPLCEDPRFATFVGRQQHRDELNDAIAGWTAGREATDVMELLQAAGVPAGLVQSGADLAADPHLAARGFIETVSHPILGEITMAGLPIHFSATGPEPYRSPPPLGSDNEYVITELLGHSPEELARWQEQEIVY